MKDGLSEIVVILDRSGSMQSTIKDTIGGFSSFLSAQKALPGEATLTLVQFDNEYQVDYLNKPLHQVEPLNETTYKPRGSTALYDAIGRTVSTVGKRLAEIAEDKRPANVLVMIITDGYENASVEYSADVIKSMIEHQKSKYNWQFVFMGANQDAILAAGNLGINRNSALTYGQNSKGIAAAFASASNVTAQYRATGSTAEFSEKDRDSQKSAGVV